MKANSLLAHEVLERVRDAATVDTDDAHVRQQLADRWGVDAVTVSAFIGRHSMRISRVRDDPDDEFAGMWSARRAARVAHLERDVELLDEAIQAMIEGDATNIPEKLMRLKHSALQQIADQTGQLVQRVAVSGDQEGETLRVELVGVDPEDLS